MASTRIGTALLAVLITLASSTASAQKIAPQDLAGLSMEDLLKIKVTGASKFLQDVREAPASITVITAEDIRHYGHRTLADVLRSVRGIYTTDDRNYTYLGVRGMSRPGDYNTRVLLLIDGHRVNDGIYDMAPVGTDLPIDLAMIERVEVIRGPASSLYGTSAFFGVINVITRNGSQRRGTQVEIDGGTMGTSRVSASFGRLFDDGREVLVSASGYRSSGNSELFFPEFADTPQGGMARDLDRDRTATLFGAFSTGHFSFHASLADRLKTVPTGAYGAAFGDERFDTSDRRAYVDASYEGPLGANWSGIGRVAYDYYGYHGRYPYDYGDAGVLVFEDGTNGQAVSAELAVRRRVGTHQITAGFESRFSVRGHQWSRDPVLGPQLDSDQRASTFGVYVEDEMPVSSWLLATAGLRIDKLAGYGSRTTPRLALVLLPRQDMSLKMLYGRAFRAPNAYERYYYGTQSDRPRLDAEQVSSGEIVWEQTFRSSVRATMSAFRYSVGGLIEQRSGDADDLFFANGQGMRGKGIEFDLESRFDSGIVASVSHSVTEVTDSVSGEPVSNSPRHLSKMGLQLPLGPMMLAVEGAYVGSRLTIGGERLSGYFVPNVTLSTPLRRFSLQLGVYNALDSRYADPGAEEHAQQSIPQNGRVALARLKIAF